MIIELLKRINEVEIKEDISFEEMAFSYPILSLADEIELFKIYKITQEKLFKDIIFKCHLRDVYKTCNDKSGYRQDMISEGIILLYKLIDNYEFTYPYISFKKILTKELRNLFKELREDNNDSLDTRMSTYDLSCLERKGKNLTESSDSMDLLLEETEKEELLSVRFDKSNYYLSDKEVEKIKNSVFKDNPKIKKNIYHKKIKPGELEY
jgi:hypothetical protein